MASASVTFEAIMQLSVVLRGNVMELTVQILEEVKTIHECTEPAILNNCVCPAAAVPGAQGASYRAQRRRSPK